MIFNVNIGTFSVKFGWEQASHTDDLHEESVGITSGTLLNSLITSMAPIGALIGTFTA